MSSSANDITRPNGIKVEVRRMKFPFESEGFDRYWFAGSAFKSLFWTQLSTSFGPGEKFFIDSARALKDEIKDPALMEEMWEFCKQEGHHTFQHLKFDRLNAAHGIDIASCEKRYRRLLDRTRRRYGPMNMMAVTVGLEHFTASLAERLLADPYISKGADPKIFALWEWHAVEECEHKATCYDIYVVAGGSYFRRVFLLLVSWSLILGTSLINTAILLKNDKRLFTRDTLSGLNYLFGWNGLVTRLVPRVLDFMRPSFHPWQHDNSAAVLAWQSRSGKYIDTSRSVKSTTAEMAPSTGGVVA